MDAAHRVDGIGLLGPLVGPVALYAREAQGEPAGILRAFLEVVESDLDHQLRPDMHRPLVARNGALLQFFGLPGKHGIGHALEGLAQHDESTARRISRAEVQVRQPSAPPSMAPFRREHDQVEGAGAFHLQPAGAAPAGFIRRIQRLGHHALVPCRERLAVETLGLARVRGDYSRGDQLARQRSAQRLAALAHRMIEERRAVAVEAIEKEHRERQLAALRCRVLLAAEPAHRHGKWVRPAVRSQGDGLAVEDELRCRNVPYGGADQAHQEILLFGSRLHEKLAQQRGALPGRAFALDLLQSLKGGIDIAEREGRSGGMAHASGLQPGVAHGELALPDVAGEIRQRNLDFRTLERPQEIRQFADLGEAARRCSDLVRDANQRGKTGHAVAVVVASAGSLSSSERSRCSLSRSWRRSTIMSIAPFSSRNSARWKPSGSFCRTVCSMTRGPAKPISAFGSASTTSPIMAKLADTPPMVGSVSTVTNGRRRSARSVSAAVVLAICRSDSAPSCMRAPPEAQTHTNGSVCSMATRTPRTKRSPTTEPIQPPMKSNSKAAHTRPSALIDPCITTSASPSAVCSCASVRRSA